MVYVTVNVKNKTKMMAYMQFSLNTRKYPLRGYILGVLTHTNALDWLWGGDGTLTM